MHLSSWPRAVEARRALTDLGIAATDSHDARLHVTGWDARCRRRNVEPFLTRVPAVSKAGAGFDQDRKNRSPVRRWAERNGYDLTGVRTIPPTVRRAYEDS